MPGSAPQPQPKPRTAAVRRPKTTRDDRRRALEGRLLDAVQRLTQDGTPFSRLTVEELAAEAGVARSTFYFHFADKAALVHRLGEKLLTDLTDEAAVLWQEPLPGRDGLFSAVLGVLRLYRDRYPVFAAVTETAVTDPEVLALLGRHVDAITTSLAERLRRGRQAGVVGPVILPETAAAFVTLMERTCYNELRDAGEDTIRRHAEVLTTIMWNTLVPRDGDRPPTSSR